MGVTIKDVAKLAGTSTATVSKVLNDSYSISEATRKKVQQAMVELNYHPNQRARNFARQNSNTVAFVTTLGKDASFKNPHMFEMLCGIEEKLSAKGYSFIASIGIIINFSIGVGVFGLPYSFYSGGLPLSMIMIITTKYVHGLRRRVAI